MIKSGQQKKQINLRLFPNHLWRHLDETGFNANSAQPIFRSIKKVNSHQQRAQKEQHISPQHSEMIRYVQEKWKGVEQDYKKSDLINNIDISNRSTNTSTSTPLLLTSTYHHTTNKSLKKDTNRQDSFKPFDLEAFWGNRILKRLTDEL